MSPNHHPFFARARRELQPLVEGLGFALDQEKHWPDAFGSSLCQFSRGDTHIRLTWDGKEGALFVMARGRGDPDWFDLPRSVDGRPLPIDRGQDAARIERALAAVEEFCAGSPGRAAAPPPLPTRAVKPGVPPVAPSPRRIEAPRRKCLSCRAELPADATRCPRCGATYYDGSRRSSRMRADMTSRMGHRKRMERGASTTLWGGVAALVAAAVWFVLGWQSGYIYFYPIVLAVLGISGIVTGLTGASRRAPQRTPRGRSRR